MGHRRNPLIQKKLVFICHACSEALSEYAIEQECEYSCAPDYFFFATVLEDAKWKEATDIEYQAVMIDRL